MGSYDDYIAIVNALKAILEAGVPELTDENGNVRIVFGEKTLESVIFTPVCFILPGAEAIEDMNFTDQIHRPEFEVMILHKGMDLDVSLDYTIQIASKAYDAIMADRTLNGTVSNLLITNCDRGGGASIPAGPNQFIHANVLSLQCEYDRQL